MPGTILYAGENVIATYHPVLNPGENVVITFSHLFNDGGEHKPFAEKFLSDNSISHISIVPTWANWYQSSDMEDCISRVRDFWQSRFRTASTYGSSMGGFGAITFRERLKASRVLALSPQYSADPSVLLSADTRWEKERSGIVNFLQPMPSGNDYPVSAIIYDPFHPQDRWHAEMISRNRSAKLIPLPFAGHNVARHLVETKQLSDFVTKFLTVADGEAGPIANELILGRRRLRRISQSYWANMGLQLQARKPKLAGKALEVALSFQTAQNPEIMAYVNLILNEKPAEALEWISKLPHENLKNVVAKASALANMGNYAESAAILLDNNAIFAQYPTETSKVAVKILHSGNYSDAANIYEKLSVYLNKKDYIWIYYLKSLSKIEIDNRSVNAAVEAFELFPENPNILELAGWIILKAKYFHKAAEILKLAIKLRPVAYTTKYLEEATSGISSGVGKIWKHDYLLDSAPTKLFPIGSSRLHEPLGELLKSKHLNILFPRMGYFHSPRQIEHLVKWLNGTVELDVSLAGLFFRRDGTFCNKFDEDIFDPDKFYYFRDRVRALWKNSDACILEISSDVSFLYDTLPLQGNPNFLRNVPYSEVWKGAGYYDRYEPEIGVKPSTPSVFDEFVDDIQSLVNECSPKCVILVPHHSDGTIATAKRERIRKAVLNDFGSNVSSIDTQPIVARHGFRILADGSLDIHHLAWEGVAEESQVIGELVSRLRI